MIGWHEDVNENFNKSRIAQEVNTEGWNPSSETVEKRPDCESGWGGISSNQKS